MPKGQGKSPLAAAIALCLLFADGEAAAEIYSVAGDREQAQIVFDDGKNLMCEELAAECEILRRSIYVPSTRSRWKVLSSKDSTKHGFRPSGIVFDEFHIQKKRDLFDTLRLGLPKRSEPLLVIITTAGVYDPEGLSYTEHLYAKAVVDGKIINPRYYSVIFAADKEDDSFDPKTWRKACPSLGVTIKEADLAEVFQKAADNPAELSTVKQLYLNIWAEPVIEHGLDMTAWDECPEQLIISGADCYIGLDLSSKLDLTALVVLFPHGDGTYTTLPYFWMPDHDLLGRQRRDIFDYPRYVKQGLITATPGTWIDQGSIREKLLSLREHYNILEVAYDPHNASDLATWMEDEGFNVVELQQGFKTLSEPSKLFTALVQGKKIRHGNNPVFTWHASNTAFKRNEYDELRPMKTQGQLRRKMDAIVGAIMALRQATTTEEPDAEPMITFAGGGDAA